MSGHINIRLRAIRIAAGLSQARLADVSGVAQHRLSGYERGAKLLRPEEAASLAKALQDPEAARPRPKRYRIHLRSARGHDPRREARQKPTPGNSAFSWASRSMLTWSNSMPMRRAPPMIWRMAWK